MGKRLDFIKDWIRTFGKHKFSVFRSPNQYPYTKEQFQKFLDVEMDLRQKNMAAHEYLKKNMIDTPLATSRGLDKVLATLSYGGLDKDDETTYMAGHIGFDRDAVHVFEGRRNDGRQVVVGDLRTAKTIKRTSYGLLIDDNTPVRIDGDFELIQYRPVQVEENEAA